MEIRHSGKLWSRLQIPSNRQTPTTKKPTNIFLKNVIQFSSRKPTRLPEEDHRCSVKKAVHFRPKKPRCMYVMIS